jgi:hypothetical protein
MNTLLPRRWRSIGLRLTAGAGLLLAMCAVLPTLAAPDAPIAPQEARYQVYLALTVANKANTTPPPQETPPPNGASGALFMQPEKKVAGPSLKVDAQGGMHMVYYDSVPLAEKPAATYAYCPPPAAQCGDSSKWSYLSMGDQIDQAQLQLTPAGNPRLLLGYHALSQYAELYIYGECDSNCTASEDSWNFIAVTSRSLAAGGIADYYLPVRTFALDPQGRPAFVFYDRNTQPEPDHTGGYYVSCQADCTTDGSWTEVRFTHRNGYYDELVDQPVLQFTSEGAPRILATLYPLNGTGDSGIYYFACDSNCDSDAGWARTLIIDRGSGPYPVWDLALDAQDRPRVAYFRYDALDDTRQTLFYLWCDANCVGDGSWQQIDLGLPKGDGIGADLVLDATGRPRIAYLASSDLGYAWCDGDCTTAQGWQHGYADSDDKMTAEYPIALPFTCSAGIWDSYSPSLALDNAGNPRIAYDASYKGYCQYQDPTDPSKPPTSEFREIWHSVRTVFTEKP